MLPSQQLQAVASLAARRAGEYVLAHLDRREDANSANRFDVKHKLDVEAQEVAVSTILKAFPDHAILGEESESDEMPENDYVWIIDPIDGTVNFFHGLHWWCCSIAVQHNGRRLAGSVFLPEMNDLYEATFDGPATCNGRVIQVSDTCRVDMALITTGMGKWRDSDTAFRLLKKISEIAQRPRMMGAAAADLCMVACGKTDGFFESGICIWDMAAGSLILERAGGTCEILKAWPNKRLAVLASNGKLQQTCRDALMPIIQSSP